jgi:parallel beta-helix repeat protein
MLVGCLGINSSSTTITLSSPSGMTQAWDPGGKRHEFADQLLDAPGPTGSRTWTMSSARDWVGWLAALRPAPGGPSPTPSHRRRQVRLQADPDPGPTPTPTPGSGSAFFVSPSGDDLGPGTAATPWQTLQHALNQAPSGATITLADGSYPGASWTRSGLTVVGGAGATITTPIVISAVTSATLRGLTISTGFSVAGRSGVDVRNSSGVLLEGLTVAGNSWGIELEHVTNSIVRDNELTDNAAGLEATFDGAGVVISGNHIHDNDRFWTTDRSSTGVAFSYVTGPLTFSGNSVHGNQSPVGQPADGVGIEVYAASGLTISDNLLYDNREAVRPGRTRPRPRAGCSSPAMWCTRAALPQAMPAA